MTRVATKGSQYAGSAFDFPEGSRLRCSRFHRWVVGAAISVALAGCATTGPYAEVTGERLARADGREEEVVIVGIDGKLDLTRPKRSFIDPGQRMVLLDTVRQGKRRRDTSVIVPLNAKACLRYHFVARHETMTAVDPWDLVLTNVEPIPECVAKFPDHAPVPATKPAEPSGKPG
jgi:hypothetical protein